MIVVSLIGSGIAAGLAATRAHSGEDPGSAVMMAVVGVLVFFGCVVESVADQIIAAVRSKQ